jgi:tripartite-type tricarboxylate transporter receptor subunit TctC
MSEILGQTIVVEDRGGAGGNIGGDYVAKSAPDGYTLLFATVSTNAINPGLYKHMPYDAIKDFAPVARVGVTPTLLLVNPSVPATDVKSLIALLKANTIMDRPAPARSFISAAKNSKRWQAASKSPMCRTRARRRWIPT